MCVIGVGITDGSGGRVDDDVGLSTVAVMSTLVVHGSSTWGMRCRWCVVVCCSCCVDDVDTIGSSDDGVCVSMYNVIVADMIGG